MVLPDLIVSAAYGGNWPAYEAALYEVFDKDFMGVVQPKCCGVRVSVRKTLVDGRPESYWHVTTEYQENQPGSNPEDKRIHDPRRCERLPWIKPMIEAAGTADAPAWFTRRSRRGERLVISLPDFSHAVILDVRRDYYLLVTAFPVEKEHRRRKLERECKASKRLTPPS
jgi:hypothetical protein